MKKQRSFTAKTLAWLATFALLVSLVIPFGVLSTGVSAEADSFEGWSHISKDATTPGEYLTYNETTKALHFNTKDSGSQEMLFLNRHVGVDDGKNSSSYNVSKFGSDNMTDFVVEYDVEITAFHANGGMLEFAFMNEPTLGDDLQMSSIVAGNTNDHTIFWCRGAYWKNNTWVSLTGNGYNDLGGYYGKAITGTGKHHLKIEKKGWDLTLTLDDEVPFETTLPSDKSLPESGFMGFTAKGVDGVVSNVQVTNSTTGDSETYFASEQTPTIEGWAHISTNAATPGEYLTYDADSRVVTFNTVASGSTENLYLNRQVGDGKDSSTSNLTKFGVGSMENFVIEYDVEITEVTDQGGMIELAFLHEYYESVGNDLTFASITAGNTDAHNIFWCRGNYWKENTWKTLEGGGWGDLGGYYGTPILGTGKHHMKIEKDGMTLSMTMDGEPSIEVELTDSWVPTTGMIGFYAKGANGSISDVVVTNSTTGDKEAFFGDGVGANPTKDVADLEGWSGFCNTQADTISCAYQRGDSGAVFFDAMNCEADFLYLNSPYGTSEAALDNAAKFPVDGMENFTVEFDFSLRDLNSELGGALNFAFGCESESNPGLASTVLQMNGSATALKYEYHIVGNYGLLPNTNPENVMVGNDTHHVLIKKDGRNLTVVLDDYAALENYTLPETIEAGNGGDGHATPASGYMAFWFRLAKGYIANVQVTNDTTGDTEIYFEDYAGSLDFWEMGGGDTTNLLAVTPEKGTGVYAESLGESPDNTTLKYLLPLDLTDLTFTFVPKVITTTDYDDQAWMGFALTDTDKDYNPNVPAKSAGFVAEIQTAPDGKAVLTFKSLLQDEEYATHTATYTIDSFTADTAYTFGTKYTDAGLEIYLNGEKIALLDWLKGVYRKGYGYLTTTASCTDGFPQAWAVMEINGENAVDYDSGLFDDGFDDEDYTGDNIGGDGDTTPSPDTGDTAATAAWALLLVAGAVCGIIGKMAKKKA